ncbi:MAG: hypothetical protein NDI61_11680 [Bdellovibrionaceae bacterium]|nr:hypothetical protein [Pseudobdellovibrionaceae bacterium]
MSSVRTKQVLLFFPMDMLSHMLRCLQLADAVKDFAVCYFATEQFHALIEGRGHRAVTTKCLSAEMIIKKGQEGDSSWVSADNLEPVMLDQARVIREIQPDAVVNDYSFTAHLAAELTGKPCLSMINGLFSKYLAVKKGVPPSHPLASVARFIPQVLIDVIQNLVFRRLHKAYRVLRKKYGLSQTRKCFMEEFEGDINLLLDSCEFAPQAAIPENYHAIGALFHVDSKFEDKLIERLDSRKKTILVNMGSSGQVERVSFLNSPEYRRYNVIVVGKDTSALKADHIIAAPFLSLESVLPHVDLVLTQAGTGNVLQALSHGIPVFCYPTFFEQEWNALRVQELGYGVMLTGNENKDTMAGFIQRWTEKKATPKFDLLVGTINVAQTKMRFRHLLAHFFSLDLGHVSRPVEKTVDPSNEARRAIETVERN